MRTVKKQHIDTRHLFKKGFESSNSVIKMDDQNLKLLQQVLLKILRDYIGTVDKLSIDYTLGGGSVLGAIRHKGFIPWDDDIDINMTRKSYQRLLEVFNQELGDKYELVGPERGENHGMANAQIKKKGTLYQSFNELSKPKSECGISIDVFVVENTYDFALFRLLHGIICLAMGYILTCRKTYNDMPYLEKYLANEDLKRAFMKKARIGKIFGWISLDTITRWTANCYSLCKNHNSKYVTIPSGRKHYFGEMCKREYICNSVNGMFETLCVKIPQNYRSYMTRLYGEDYMQLPPEEKREMHPLMAIDFGK